jgi:bifunctional UDP-N-acetylglucosamine pyrophosphorylase/glucosamine-1-phosphate N-acetyltransferase
MLISGTYKLRHAMAITVIILAAGQGKRMYSALPKVLHPLAGSPLLRHVLTAAHTLKPREIRVVHGHGGAEVMSAFGGDHITWVEQGRQLGTGHAVKQALPGVPPSDVVLVLYGDVPLVTPATLRKLVAKARTGKLTLLTAQFADPTGYGRIIRAERGHISAIVEEKDATRDQRALTEVNTGLLACPGGQLREWVGRLKANNAQREYYLTDVVALAVRAGQHVAAVRAESESEVMGVNDKAQLAEAEGVLRRRVAAGLMKSGVTLLDPARLDVRGALRCGRDVSIDANVIFEGDVTLGDRVNIGPCSVIRNARIGAGTRIHPHCVIEEAEIGEGCEIGPYARMRPGVRMADGAKLGNFVEVKKSTIGRRSKVNHLAYIGDATIGERVNVGAGTITCNYDGANKHRTIIEDDVFVGSDVQLVAPVTIGRGATIGAGATITKNVPAGELTISERKQVTRYGWKRPVKATKPTKH